MGDANGLGGEGGKGVEQGPCALRGFVSERHANAHGMTSRLLLFEHIGLSPLLVPFRCRNVLNFIGISGLVVRMGHLERKSPGRHCALLLNRFKQCITSHALVQEFEPCLLPFGTLAFSVKNAKNGLRDGNQFFRWNPIVKDFGRGGLGSESAPDEQFDQGCFWALRTGMTPRSCMMPRPVSASELENETLNFRPISWQTGFLKKKRHNASAHGRTIERFIRVEPCERRCGDVAHGVATSFAKGHLALFKFRPELGTVLEFHMVDLNVLSGRQMVFAGGIFVADVENGTELVKRQKSHGHFDSDHLNAGLPLSIDAACKAEASKSLFIHATFFVQ